MCNTHNNYDPRGWRDRSNFASRHSGHRSGCHPRPGCGPRLRLCSRRTAHARRLPVSATLAPSPVTVPDRAGLVSIILSAAQEHFLSCSYATADAFLKLIPQPTTHPAATWQQLGHLHFSLAEYDPAGRAYGYAAAYDPKDASLQVRLAHTCLRLNDIPSFEGYLGRALALDPESAPALQLLADLNRDHGRYADAARFYGELISTQSDRYENLLSLALCHSYLGDNDTAMGCLQRAGRIARGALSPATF